MCQKNSVGGCVPGIRLAVVIFFIQTEVHFEGVTVNQGGRRLLKDVVLLIFVTCIH